MNETNPVLSSLQITHFVFDEIQFNRIGFQKKDNLQNEVNISVNIGHSDENEYIVSLILSAKKEEEYNAHVKISAYCVITSEIKDLQQTLRENVPAILLPYARAQLTLLTAQPETDPIVLPVINVRELYKASTMEKNE